MKIDENTLEANGVDDDSNKDGETETETELETDLYKETKIKRDANLAAKAQKYTRYTIHLLIYESTRTKHANIQKSSGESLKPKSSRDQTC